VTALDPLSEEVLVRILTDPRNALAKQYQKFFQLENARLEFTPGALRAIARKAMKRDVGARALRAVVEDLMLAMLFELPEQQRPGTVYEINESMVEGDRPPTLLETVKVIKEKESA
jgi:ATP-dependent Clp protease ATP-binding subunit ClpX